MTLNLFGFNSTLNHNGASEGDIEGDIREVELRQLTSLVERGKRGFGLKPTEFREIERLQKKLFGQQPQGEAGSAGILNTLKEVAEHYGKSERTIRRWSKAGMPILPGNRYDLDQIDQWLDIRQGISDGEKPQTEPRENLPAQPEDGKDFWDKENKKHQARLRQLEYKKRRGELLERREVIKLFVARIEAVKRGLLALERALPNQLVTCNSEREMANIIRRVVRSLLETFSRRLPKIEGSGNE